MEGDERAQAAYEAYARYLGIDKQPGSHHWADLPAQRKEAWRRAAAAARVEGGDGGS